MPHSLCGLRWSIDPKETPRYLHKINGHSPASRRRPFQMTVEFSELQSEGLPLLEIAFGELH